MITEQQILDNSHIPNEEIEMDIADTQKEVDQYEAENKVMAKDRQRNRVAIYMNEGRILKAKGFIADLKAILNYRINNPQSP